MNAWKRPESAMRLHLAAITRGILAGAARAARELDS
jgi:hypothetical protein